MGAFEYKIEHGGEIDKLAVDQCMFAAGQGKAFLVTFLSPPPTLQLMGDTDDFIEVMGLIKCSCGHRFPFELEFSGASGGGEIRCPSCGSGYGQGFGYRRIGGNIDTSGFLFWFSPNSEREFGLEQVQVRLTR